MILCYGIFALPSALEEVPTNTPELLEKRILLYLMTGRKVMEIRYQQALHPGETEGA